MIIYFSGYFSYLLFYYDRYHIHNLMLNYLNSTNRMFNAINGNGIREERSGWIKFEGFFH